MESMNYSTPAPEEEFIHTPDSSEPFWSESFGHWCFSPDNRMALWFHFQRNHENTDLWRELIIIKCDDGTVLVGKSIGVNSDTRNPGANALSIQCLEPFKSWRVSFDGALRQVKMADLMNSPFTDGEWQPARLTLDCHAHAPVWSMQTGEIEGGWANAHYEQAFRYAGELHFSGQTHVLEGLGMRDHSYGSRHAMASSNIQWFNGQFPSGRCFFLVRVITADGQTFDDAHIIDSGEFFDAQIENLSTLEHPEPKAIMHVQLKSKLGVCTIRGEYVYGLPISILGATELVPGRITKDCSKFVYDCSLCYTWDNEEGYGAGNLFFTTEG